MTKAKDSMPNTTECLVDYTDYMTEKGGRPWSLFGGYGDEE